MCEGLLNRSLDEIACQRKTVDSEFSRETEGNNFKHGNFIFGILFASFLIL